MVDEIEQKERRRGNFYNKVDEENEEINKEMILTKKFLKHTSPLDSEVNSYVVEWI